MAWQCYHRFNNHFVSPFANSHSSNYPHSSAAPFAPPPQAMTAMYASPVSVSDSAWYLDSSASNHFATTANHLDNYFAYSGGEQIYLANDSSIPILNVGSAKIQQFSFGKPLLLNHLLHVPASTKNLISVSKFAFDNCVFF